VPELSVIIRQPYLFISTDVTCPAVKLGKYQLYQFIVIFVAEIQLSFILRQILFVVWCTFVIDLQDLVAQLCCTIHLKVTYRGVITVTNGDSYFGCVVRYMTLQLQFVTHSYLYVEFELFHS